MLPVRVFLYSRRLGAGPGLPDLQVLSSLRALGEPLPRDDAVHCTVASGSARLGASRSAAPPTDSGNSRYSNLGILKILLGN